MFYINKEGLLPKQYAICIGFGISVILMRFLFLLVPEKIFFRKGIITKDVDIKELKKFNTLKFRKRMSKI